MFLVLNYPNLFKKIPKIRIQSLVNNFINQFKKKSKF